MGQVLFPPFCCLESDFLCGCQWWCVPLLPPRTKITHNKYILRWIWANTLLTEMPSLWPCELFFWSNDISWTKRQRTRKTLDLQNGFGTILGAHSWEETQIICWAEVFLCSCKPGSKPCVPKASCLQPPASFSPARAGFPGKAVLTHLSVPDVLHWYVLPLYRNHLWNKLVLSELYQKLQCHKCTPYLTIHWNS